MILQALKEYYDRKAANPESGIAPLGWEWKEIPYLINISSDGQLIALEDTQEGRRAKRFLLPSLGESKGNGIKANFPWENAEYIFGEKIKEDKNGKVNERHQAFLAILKEYSDCDWAIPMLRFYERNEQKQIATRYRAEWKQILKGKSLLFAIEGVPVTELQSFRTKYKRTPDGDMVVCLVTGERDVLKEKEPAIKGNAFFKQKADQKVQAEIHIVSFNHDAFRFFEKKQGENAPIGRITSLSYATALNSLLSFDSKQKMLVGDATVVFWAAKKDVFEDVLARFFTEPQKDDPDCLVKNVEALFKSPQTGVATFSEDATRFYVLGLSPNVSRVAVRFWQVGTVAEMAERFRTYFEDLMIVHGPDDKDHLSLWRLLVSTAVQGKSENIAPNLAGNVMRSILEGRPFPETLMQATLLRIKAEHEVSYSRAKLIKGCLNRKWRFNNPNKERMLTMSLDKENRNIGYRLGRLFAVLERIQEKANGATTVKDRFFASASSAPVTAFGNLMRLSQHHLSKIKKEKPGYAVILEKQLQEIVDGLSAFPAHLSLDDQGQFAIGYYHQRQDFFTKKDAE